ncbi:hypothetical protein [Xanthobacter autotrophicus]|uniref:hypothetical protein n=1 Tax=Xanthobacter autotrophicus TaxID=280 RepID=UPI0024A74116|nr:hypothetical protein [Xanthobacter autotrophicus]MDI4656792.1 hypothetical protein [Xanthobacter autotrophicus]
MTISTPLTGLPRNGLRTARRLVGTLVVAGALACGIASAVAEQAVSLFKIITVRDEIVVGVGPQDAAALGGSDVTAVGRALKGGGELTVWQYAVRKAPDGELEQAPARRISIIGNDSLRVEPYATPLRVIAPK